ncbi:MAG: S1 RNA-binding domain-containing protein [Sedimentisphaerales bacterium]|nr:S1 RNA-binding domain-containing protein [Sedimentisphaerales bacterium]
MTFEGPVVFIIALPSAAALGLFALVVYGLKNPEKVELWSSYVARMLAWFSQKAERASVGRAINGHFKSFSKSISEVVPEAVPYGMKIEWVETADPEAFVQQDEVIVRMRHHRNQDRNYVAAALAYTSKAVLPHTRSHLPERLRKAIDLAIAHRLLSSETRGSAATAFLEDELLPKLKGDEELSAYSQGLDLMDDKGLFDRMLLREYVTAGHHFGAKLPTQNTRDELRRFYEFVHTITNRGPREYVPLTFEGMYLKAAVILVAQIETYQEFGLLPYQTRLVKCVHKGFPVVYLLARGINIPIACSVAKWFCREYGGRIIHESRFKATVYNYQEVSDVICVVLSTNYSSLAERARTLMTKAWSDGTQIDARITGITHDGIHVDIRGYPAFVGSSELSHGYFRQPADLFKEGDMVAVSVLDIDDSGKPTVSVKSAVPDPWERARADITIDSIQSCAIVDADSKRALVSVNGEFRGVIPSDEISWTSMPGKKSLLGTDEIVEAKVIGYDDSEKRVVLSLKQMQPNPVEALKTQYPVGSVINGKVTWLHDEYAFLGIAEGVTGFLPVSELSWNWVEKTGDVLHVGQVLRAKVLDYYEERPRLTCSLKAMAPDPYEEANLTDGAKVSAKVIRYVEGGAVVEIKPGVQGFIAKHELAYSNGPFDASDVVELGQILDCVILSIDVEHRKLRLSRKQLLADPRIEIQNRFKKYEEIRGKVLKTYPHGFLVGLSEGIHGFLPIELVLDKGIGRSQLTPGKSVNCGISRIDQKTGRIELFIPD